MAISVGKLAPSAVALAFMGYCAWPSVSDLVSTSQAQKPPEKILELAASLFSPKLAPCPVKNPFGGLDAASLAAALEMASKGDATKAKGAGSGSDAAKNKTKNPYDPIGGLKLQATCIIDNQRVAMINGKMYAPQENLPTGNSLVPTFKIIDILPTKVLLGDKERILELTYSNIVARPVSSPQAGKKRAKPAEPDAAAEKPPAKKPSAASTKVKADENNGSSAL